MKWLVLVLVLAGCEQSEVYEKACDATETTCTEYCYDDDTCETTCITECY